MWDKPPTNTPKPTNTHRPPPPDVPIDPPAVPTDTPLSTNTSEQTLTFTNTPDYCICDSTPTVLGIPTCTFTPTPTASLTATNTVTHTAQPGLLLHSPEPSRTLPPTNTDAMTVTQTVSGPAAGILPVAGSAQGGSGDSGGPAWTPIHRSFPWSAIDIGPNVSTNANGMSFLLLLAAFVMGCGAVFALKLMGSRDVLDTSAAVGVSSAATSINPITVGAFGNTARFAGQVPLLSYGESIVLAKVGNGIGSAIKRIGGISDLRAISVTGMQEFLQLTATGPFPSMPVRSAGLAG